MGGSKPLAALQKRIRDQIAAICLRLIGQLLKRTSREWDGKASAHILASQDTSAILIAGLESFLRLYPQFASAIFIHDDGSLLSETIRRIKDVFPGATVITREQADRDSLEFLKDYPSLREARSNFIMLKFLDPMFYAPTDRFCLIDTDIMFYEPLATLQEWLEASVPFACYLTDEATRYGVSDDALDQLEARLGCQVIRRINAGFLLLPKSALRLDLAGAVMEILEESPGRKKFFDEQTIHAILLSKFGNTRALPESEMRMYDGPASVEMACSVHFAGHNKWHTLPWRSLQRFVRLWFRAR